ncbi:PREDICTED: lactoperoxidase-like [Amphimedon queenslandica]|uniref:Ig-like domain-containing protein n=1 Tax=Amphimedon queenslandica TaxID=400682 RepID=A0A1X7V1V9_AMPQE|nr:PREDICTED: lactoperoxidase-like [Amphimedon queenslandica]|eukprot:XP_019851140.1 PREDICTED: lactoperoxidase-like [Amphimedon queenslandica]
MKEYSSLSVSRWTLLVSLLLCISLVSAGSNRVQASSPGWDHIPRDVKAMVGQYAFFNCQNRLPHNRTFWLLEGRRDIFSTRYASRASIHNKGRMLRFGPLQEGDDRISINCEVLTQYGLLPSPLGMIYVQTPPKYNASSMSVFIGQPCLFEFDYSGARPDSYRWYKNGRRYYGEINRVKLTYKSIAFTKVLQHDSGIYEVQSKNIAGTGRGSSYLRVIFWWKNGTQSQHAGLSQPELPMSLAVLLAIGENKTNVTSLSGTRVQVSASDSSAYVMRLLRKLSLRASDEARMQGEGREEVENILRRMVRIVGHPLQYLNSSDMEAILNATVCRQATMQYNCLDESVLRYRTINGTCNNLFFPLNGAANMAFARMLPAVYEDGISQPLGYTQARAGKAFEGPWPSPRYISWHLVKDLDHTNSRGLTHMFMAWGQFLDHDLDLAPVFEDEVTGEELECGCNYTNRCFPIPVRHDDPVFGTRSSHSGECLPLTRSIPACRCGGQQNDLSRTQLNQLTSFIDGSQIYGSDNKKASDLRMHIGGLLKSGGVTGSRKENLPFQDKQSPMRGGGPLFDAGDPRSNEVITLSVMHTIWLREHNRIANELSEINPCWDDERIYQEARRIVGAKLQIITYEEFLPVLFGQYYSQYVSRYFGYNPFVDATIPNEFSAAAFRFGHSLIRPTFQRLDKNWNSVPEGPLPLERSFFNPSEYFKSNGTDPLLRGLLTSVSRDVDEFLNSVLTTKLFTESPEESGMDLASLNIQRGRDHGIPPYRKWREFCDNVYPRRNPPFQYPNTERVMREIYGEEGYRDGMDLWVGGLSEKKLQTAQVGPTFACILGMTFTRLRDGDRFWYESSYNFFPSQLVELRKTKLSKVVCTNADDIDTVQPNVFRSNQRRISCGAIPQTNLQLWRDNSCSPRRSTPIRTVSAQELRAW